MLDAMEIFRTTVRVAHMSRPADARIFAGDRSAISAVVFAEPTDMVLLGAHGLQSLNLRIDLGRKELVPAGPLPAAALA